MHKLYVATGQMPANFSSRADKMSKAFSWKPNNNDLFWQEFLTAISTMLVVLSTLTGNIAVTAAGAFLGGVVTEILNVILQHDEEAKENLSM